jgi:hypothetical protein
VFSIQRLVQKLLESHTCRAHYTVPDQSCQENFLESDPDPDPDPDPKPPQVSQPQQTCQQKKNPAQGWIWGDNRG